MGGGTRPTPLPNPEPSWRAFVRLRKVLNTHEEFARKLAELEQKYDQQFQVVFQAIRELLTAPQAEPERPRIGFARRDDEPSKMLASS